MAASDRFNCSNVYQVQIRAWRNASKHEMILQKSAHIRQHALSRNAFQWKTGVWAGPDSMLSVHNWWSLFLLAWSVRSSILFEFCAASPHQPHQHIDHVHCAVLPLIRITHDYIQLFFLFSYFDCRECRQACATSAAVRVILLVSVKMEEVLEAVVVASNYDFLHYSLCLEFQNLSYSYALCPEAFGYCTYILQSTSNGW